MNKEHDQEEQMQKLQLCLVDSEYMSNYQKTLMQEKIKKLEKKLSSQEEEKLVDNE